MVKGADAEAIRKAEAGDYLTLDPAFCQVKKAARFLGGTAADRVSILLGQIGELLREGAEPGSIRVICVSPQASRAFEQRLTEHLGARLGAQIEVGTTRELACAILSDPAAQAAVNRSFPADKARLLSAFEMDFVLEDLKTLGTRPRRLRQMLKFFFRGWTELADEGEGWLITVEEQETIAFLRSELRFLQGVLEPEIANLASKALRAEATVRDSIAKPHLLVNDYQDLSRASQLLCHLLATDSITVAADPTASVEVFDSYPYVAGVEEFMRVNQDAKTQTLGQSAPDIGIRSWDAPADEFEGVAKLVSERIAAGVAPRSIAVVCFHPFWSRQIADALSACGIPERELYQPLTLKGDIRDLARCLPLRIVTVLRLLAQPEDSMGWRCWAGFGDYLANSATFVADRQAASGKNPEAVFADVVAQWEGYMQSLELLASCREKRGAELLQHLTRALSVSDKLKLPPVLAPLLELGSAATPATMVALLEQMQFFAQPPPTDAVTVASLEMLAGQSYSEVIAAGFVDGFIPQRSYFDLTQITINQQKQMAKTDSHRLKLLLGATSDSLTFSHFACIDLVAAERLDLKSSRIVLEDGKRISHISLSTYARGFSANGQE